MTSQQKLDLRAEHGRGETLSGRDLRQLIGKFYCGNIIYVKIVYHKQCATLLVGLECTSIAIVH